MNVPALDPLDDFVRVRNQVVADADVCALASALGAHLNGDDWMLTAPNLFRVPCDSGHEVLGATTMDTSRAQVECVARSILYSHSLAPRVICAEVLRQHSSRELRIEGTRVC